MSKPSSLLKLIFIGSTFGLNLLLIPLSLQAQNPIPDAQGGTEDTNPGGPRQVECNDTNSQPLTAIIPVAEPSLKVQLTTLSNPTILIYIPKTTAKTVKFTVVDIQSDSSLYEAEIPLPEEPKQPGIIAVEIPKDQLELQAGVSYRWTASLICNNSVGGVITRIQPSSELTEALEKTPAEQWLVYTQAGIWYDAIAALAALRQEQPDNPQLESNWQTLFQQAELDRVATAPLIQP